MDSFEQAVTQIEDEAAQYSGQLGLSVRAVAGLTLTELLDQHPLPHRSICTSTVADIQAVGLDVVPDPWNQPGEALVLFGHLPTEEEWMKLRAAFSEPVPNPNRMQSQEKG